MVRKGYCAATITRKPTQPSSRQSPTGPFGGKTSGEGRPSGCWRAVLETELKFEIDQACAAGLIERLSLNAEGRRRQLITVYYDTPKGDLAKAGFVLRVRDDGRRRVQAVKQASQDGGSLRRGEWEHPIEGAAFDLKAARRTPLRRSLKPAIAAALGPVFVVDVERAKCDLPAGGGVVEMALDRGEVRAGGHATPIHELELELKSGSASILFDLARELMVEFPLNLAFISKAERGRMLLAGDAGGAVAARIPALKADDSAAHAFRVIANGALEQAASNAALMRAGHGAEALHQTRVGLRRLRSALTLFRPMLADKRFDVVAGELKWLAKSLDDARDLDVFLAEALRTAPAGGADEPGFDAFVISLRAAHAKAYERALAAIDSARCRLLFLDSLAWIDAGAWCESPALEAVHWRARPIKALANELLQARWRKLLKKGRKLDGLSVDQRHKLRIAGKKLRYAAGFFASLYTAKTHKRFGKAASDLQDALGALTDIAAGRTLVERVTLPGDDPLASGATPPPAFAVGRLTGHREADEAQALKTALKAFKRFEGVDRFW